MSNYYVESSLSDSYIYDMVNNNDVLTRRISNAFKTGKRITQEHLQEQILQIKRTRVSPLVDQVLSAFTNGDIMLIYAPTEKIPQLIPFTVVKMAGKNKAIVFMNNYGTLVSGTESTGGDTFNIQMKDLYALMEGAYFAYHYYEYPVRLERNIGLMKFTSSVYTQMFVRIFNKEYALSMDPELYNRVCYSVSRFYLERVWGCKNKELIHSYSCANGQGDINRSDLELVSTQYEDQKIYNIKELLEFIATLSPRVSELNSRYFVECFINTYRAQSLFGTEVLPYFIFTIIAALLGSYIVNQPIIYDILKRTNGVNTFYGELSKII